MLHFTKKRALIAGVVGALAMGSVAFAYFTTTGSGTGSATVGTSSAVTLHGTTDTTLYPGTQTVVHFTVDNPSDGHQLVNVIKLDSVSTDPAHVALGCDTSASAFTMANVTANQDVASGDGTTIAATGILKFINDPLASQDGCKNAPLTLHLSSN
jgi:hypothetical protein